ncbi:prolyl oligopeptidase family serine peptidase [Roseimicrobium gellanilyticum]|uniref:prolyl oligopeptidase family serine peptidase n=1 Tax=Roseimicrobium gellanilyticum TaxID=748857 RepID=UPI001475ABA3|nr:prolyl oligopeptidase family serine peptidase [Roseimicrobium gellanilyticum]
MRRILPSLLPCLAALCLGSAPLGAESPVLPVVENPDMVVYQHDVVYGHKDGMALIFDVVQPPKANGGAIMSIQSGGWYSGWRDSRQMFPALQPLLAKGFTVFVVWHGSSPRYPVPDAVADVRRASRFIHANASRWGIDPNRIGAYGGSAGGHLALMLATTGDDGDPKAKDPVLQASSRIAASVSLYPPTDLRKWTTEPPEEIRKHPNLKPSLTFDAKLEPEVSPILHVDAKDAAVLLIHGDKDLLVPISHSTNIMPVLQEQKVPAKLVTIEGAAHGFNKEQNVIVVQEMVDWFVKYLGKAAGA